MRDLTKGLKMTVDILGNRRGYPGRKVALEDLYMPVTEAGCWIWIGASDTRSKRQYGYLPRNMGDPYVLAHREFYRRRYGPISPEQYICHRCDVPSCVNPSHLFTATNQENTADKVAKGRQMRWERHNKAKLNRSSVESIRSDPRKATELATIFGVTPSTISSVRKRKTWRF